MVFSGVRRGKLLSLTRPYALFEFRRPTSASLGRWYLLLFFCLCLGRTVRGYRHLLCTMAVQRVSPAARCEINNAVGPREEEEDESNFAPGRLYYACCRPMRAHEESSRSPINRACRDRNSSAYAVPFLGDAVSNDFCGSKFALTFVIF